MKTFSALFSAVALLFLGAEVKAGEVSEILIGMSGAIVAHEFVGHGSYESGEISRWNFQNPLSWMSFEVEEGHDVRTVTRNVSIKALAIQTQLSEVVAGKRDGAPWSKGFVFGNAIYQIVYPVATLLGGDGDLQQYEQYGGSKAVKCGFLALGSYRVMALATGIDPLSDGKGIELTSGFDVETGGLNVSLTYRF